MATDPDEIYMVRSHFWCGNYQLAINEGAKTHPPTDGLRIERDAYVYRAYVALGNHGIVMDEITGDAPVALQAVRLLATFLGEEPGAGGGRAAALATLSEWLNDPEKGGDPTLQLVGGQMFLADDNTTEALRAIRFASTVEQLGLAAQVYLRMHRLDLADKAVKAMAALDDDSTLSQLAAAWAHLAHGGARCQEAAYVFQELIDKFGASALLQNGLACAYLHMGRFEEADKLLVDASTKGGGGGNADTLVNQVCCAQHLQKPAEVTARYVKQLQRAAPNHPWVEQYALVDAAFEKAAAGYAAEAK